MDRAYLALSSFSLLTPALLGEFQMTHMTLPRKTAGDTDVYRELYRGYYIELPCVLNIKKRAFPPYIQYLFKIHHVISNAMAQ